MRGWAYYNLQGTISVTIGRQSYPVVLPDSFTVSCLEYPEREAPNPKAVVRIFGGRPKLRPRAPDQQAGWAGIALNQTDDGSGPRPPDPEHCGGVGWHFELDSVEEPRLFRLGVTVPWGEGNSTWGLNLEPPLPWAGSGLWLNDRTQARSGDGAYEVSVIEIEEGHWQWSAQTVASVRPWLSSFELEVSTEGSGLEEPPPSLRISYWSEASEGALQADLQATRQEAIRPG